MNAIARQPDPTTANRVARREVDAHLVTTAAGMVAALHESIRRCSQANRVQGRWPEFGCSADPTNIGMPRGPEPGLSRPHLGDAVRWRGPRTVFGAASGRCGAI